MMTVQTDKFVLIPILILIFVLCLLSSFSDIVQPVSESEANLYYQLRGSRDIAENIVVVYIGDEDVAALNGWPVSRDYYSYLIHILKERNAQAIGLDILFSGRDHRYPAYDETLLEFIQSAGNVCLPFFFSEIAADSAQNRLYSGRDAYYSFDPLTETAAVSGFSNFSREAVFQQTPLCVRMSTDTVFSFGLQLTRLYQGLNDPPEFRDEVISLKSKADTINIPVDHSGNLWLNYSGSMERINGYSFVELMQTYRTQPDQLDFSGKVVVVIVTASGVAQVKETPLNKSVPASLIHISVIDNILQQNWLRSPFFLIQWLIILATALSAYFSNRVRSRKVLFTIIVTIPLFYFLAAVILFARSNLVLPLFSPAISFAGTLLLMVWHAQKLSTYHDSTHRQMLRNLLREKEAKLAESRSELRQIHEKQRAEYSQSEQTMQQLAEQKSIIDRMEKELSDLRSYIVPEKSRTVQYSGEIIHSGSGKMAEILQTINKISTDDIPVLIIGETGTGKELIAREIHRSSHRKDAAFVAINCGALSESLLESELFGHKKGSFTGATSDRKGRFELADGGTVFLDEITETSPAFQSRLLRVLQEGTFEPLGSEETFQVDIRVVAASNKDIKALMEKGLFRSDLFYRLSGVIIDVPLLRERMEDIPLLARHFIHKYSYDQITGFSEQAMHQMQKYPWPGNIRELENTVRRAALLASGESRMLIQENDLPQELINSAESEIGTIHKPLEDQILESLRHLKFSRSSITQTAKNLGDRDRGTITEYFRGMCFEQLVEAEFNRERAAKNLAGTDDPEIINQVLIKMNNYLKNLKTYASSGADIDPSGTPFQGLPGKYHTFLLSILKNFDKLSE